MTRPRPLCLCGKEWPPAATVPVLVRDDSCPSHGDDSASWERIKHRTRELAAERGLLPDDGVVEG